MKRIMTIMLIAVAATAAWAQNATKAKQILDRTAATINNAAGATASFTIESEGLGKAQGTIAIKGNKFRALTDNASTWYNGTTQWTYMKSTDEVNVSNPDERQQAQLNPYKFITIYKSGYRLGMKTISGGWEIHLTALNKGRSIQEMYINVNGSYQPTKVRILEGKKWSTITVSNFRKEQLADGIFSFPSKDYPTAEIIDLR